ncbi:MAG: putative peptidoglycan glycosyltransferase FtsW [Bacteroidales bacterium]|nr:putative peptidoglycan glycosyltransferase FtsW [Bacteroidales bacterium]
MKHLKGDRTIWLIVLFLYIVSVLAVYSSTGTLAYRFRAGNTEYYLLRHLIIIVLGFGLLFLSHNIKYKYYSAISQIALYIAVPLLVFTLFRGTSIHEASRWITLPIVNLSFQSSDFAKLALIMYLARLLTRKQEVIDDLHKAFIPMIIPVVLVCALIMPANFSTAAVLFVSCLVLMFIGRVRIKYLMAMLGIAVAGAGLLILILSSMPEGGRVQTWQNRINSFMDKENNNTYQADQAKIAIASGGFVGKLPGNSTQRNFLPQAYSDFIYAIIIEEYGFIGGFMVLLFYMILFYRGLRIANKSPGTFGALLAAGLSFGLVFQAMINMAVAVNLMPITGQPLPLISMGGTSLWFTSLSIGIILSVSRSAGEGENQVMTDNVQATQTEDDETEESA